MLRFNVMALVTWAVDVSVVRAGCVGFVCVIFRCLFGLIVCGAGVFARVGFVWILPVWVYVVFADYLLRGVSVVFDLVVSS